MCALRALLKPLEKGVRRLSTSHAAIELSTSHAAIELCVHSVHSLHKPVRRLSTKP